MKSKMFINKTNLVLNFFSVEELGNNSIIKRKVDKDEVVVFVREHHIDVETVLQSSNESLSRLISAASRVEHSKDIDEMIRALGRLGNNNFSNYKKIPYQNLTSDTNKIWETWERNKKLSGGIYLNPRLESMWISDIDIAWFTPVKEEEEDDV